VRGFKFQGFRGDLKPPGFNFLPFNPSPNNKEWNLKPPGFRFQVPFLFPSPNKASDSIVELVVHDYLADFRDIAPSAKINTYPLVKLISSLSVM